MIRAETEGDLDSIRTVLLAAFPSPAEAKLVEDLRAAEEIVLSLVADEGSVIGHIVFSRLRLMESALRAIALAPLCVLPEYQRRGIGSALVREGLSRLARAGEDLVIVVGDTRFYERFGFSREAATKLETPSDGPHLLAKVLSRQGDCASGEVHYAPAFAALG